jgi:hypothetical protein
MNSAVFSSLSGSRNISNTQIRITIHRPIKNHLTRKLRLSEVFHPNSDSDILGSFFGLIALKYVNIIIAPLENITVIKIDPGDNIKSIIASGSDNI